MNRSWTVRLFAMALVVTIALAGFGNAVKYLWNLVMPALFHLPAVDYWQAVALLGLSWIFFGSWRAFPRPHGRHRGHCHGGAWCLHERDRQEIRAGLDAGGNAG